MLIVKDYYSNFNGTLFLICGDVNQDSIMPLVLKYIGSLPSKPEPVKRLVWSADHYKTTNTTAVEKFSNPSPLCVTVLYYTWEKGFQLNQDVRALNHALQSVVSELLMNRIRVQHGDKKVTPSSLKAHLKQLLKKGNLHVGYMTSE